MSQLLGNIHSIIGAFNKYAKDDGECATLSKGELKDLIQKEFGEVIVNPQDPETIETMLHLLDKDCDGKVNFEEFTVLVFKVAKACYKKDHECEEAAEGQSKRVGSCARRQDTSALKKRPTQPPAQELEDVSEPEPRCSCPEEKQESPKSETISDRWIKEPPKQERGSRFSQKPPETCTAQREREAGQRAEKESPCQGSRRERQHCSLQQEPQTVTEEISRQSSQEPATPDECQTRGTQRRAAQKPSQPCQMEEWSHREPQKLEREMAAQQPTPHRKDAPVESQEPMEMEQGAVKPRSQVSQKEVQRPAQRGVQEPQAPEQKSTSQSCRDRQEEQPSLGCVKERTSMFEQHSTRCQEQEPQREERTRQQQECKPQTRGKGAIRRIVEEHQEAKDGSCQRPTKQVQEMDPAQSCKPDGGRQSTRQQECQSQGQEQVLAEQEEEEPPSPECQPVVTVQRQPNRDVQEPQRSGKSHYRDHECRTLRPEQTTSPQEDTKPWASGKEACCEPTERPKQTTTGCHEGQRSTRRQHETCPEESKPQNTGQRQYRSHECSPSPQERTTSQKQEREEAEGLEKETTAHCECSSLRRRQRSPEESRAQKPEQSQHRSHACQSRSPKQVPSAQEMSQTQERGARCESPEALEEATYRGQPSEQCQPCEEEQESRKPGQSQHRRQESQPRMHEQALSPKEETEPRISERKASSESVETPGKASSGGQTCQPPASEQCRSRSEEQRPQRPRQSQHHCHRPRPLEQEQALSPKEELSEREASCESMETRRKAASVDHASQSSTSEQSQRCPEEQDPQKPRGGKDHHERQSSESERDIFPQEETKPCEQDQESSGQETQGPERATAGHWEGQSSSARCQPQPEEGKPQNSGQIQYRPHECRPLTPEQAAAPQEEAKPQTQEREGSCEPTQSPTSQGPRNSSARQPFRPSWPQQHRRVLQFPSPWSPKH